jgi:hypothetical protein
MISTGKSTIGNLVRIHKTKFLLEGYKSKSSINGKHEKKSISAEYV